MARSRPREAAGLAFHHIPVPGGEFPPDAIRAFAKVFEKADGKVLAYCRTGTRSITLEAQCLGPWCSQAKPGVEVLAFVEAAGDAYRLTITPCGGMAFQEPSDADIDRVVACYQGKACAPEG